LISHDCNATRSANFMQPARRAPCWWRGPTLKFPHEPQYGFRPTCRRTAGRHARPRWARRLSEFEGIGDLILDSLKFCHGNRTRAVKMLGVSLRTMRNPARSLPPTTKYSRHARPDRRGFEPASAHTACCYQSAPLFVFIDFSSDAPVQCKRLSSGACAGHSQWPPWLLCETVAHRALH
jgi:hypothetical protein